MIEEMFGGCTQLRNVMGPESGLDTKTSPAKTTRSPPGKGSGKRDHRGVPENDHPDAHFPLTRPTSLEMCYSRPSYAATRFHAASLHRKADQSITREIWGLRNTAANCESESVNGTSGISFFVRGKLFLRIAWLC